MEKELNLCEILKNCPEGTKLYSPIIGQVEFVCIEEGRNWPIQVSENGTIHSFRSNGMYLNHSGGECILFPSKENRDWSTFNTDVWSEHNEMTFKEYQQKALQTADYPGKIVYPTLGLTGEAGEVAEKVKKVIRDKGSDFDNTDTRREIAKEIGDVLWNCTTLANDLGFTIEEIARMNCEKLQSRAQRGKIHGNGDNR